MPPNSVIKRWWNRSTRAGRVHAVRLARFLKQRQKAVVGVLLVLLASPVVAEVVARFLDGSVGTVEGPVPDSIPADLQAALEHGGLSIHVGYPVVGCPTYFQGAQDGEAAGTLVVGVENPHAPLHDVGLLVTFEQPFDSAALGFPLDTVPVRVAPDSLSIEFTLNRLDRAAVAWLYVYGVPGRVGRHQLEALLPTLPLGTSEVRQALAYATERRPLQFSWEWTLTGSGYAAAATSFGCLEFDGGGRFELPPGLVEAGTPVPFTTKDLTGHERLKVTVGSPYRRRR